MTNTLEDNVNEYKEVSSPISTIHFILYKQEHRNTKRYSSITSLAVISTRRPLEYKSSPPPQLE